MSGVKFLGGKAQCRAGHRWSMGGEEAVQAVGVSHPGMLEEDADRVVHYRLCVSCEPACDLEAGNQILVATGPHEKQGCGDGGPTPKGRRRAGQIMQRLR